MELQNDGTRGIILQPIITDRQKNRNNKGVLIKRSGIISGKSTPRADTAFLAEASFHQLLTPALGILEL